MTDRLGASLISIASIAALSGTPDLMAYGAAKAGVVHLTKSLALQLAPRKIRVNCICPGLLWTRAWELLTARMQATRIQSPLPMHMRQQWPEWRPASPPSVS